MMPWNIVFISAGWAWISNLVGILWDLWFRNLIGVDNGRTQQMEQHISRGIPVFKHWEYCVKVEDIVIYSSATADSPEVQEAFRIKKEERKPLLIWDYFEFLGELSKYFKTVGFTGTNGKSSSSAMAIAVAREVLPDFGMGIVGALVPDFSDSWSEKDGYLRSYAVGGNAQQSGVIPAQEDIKKIFQFIFTGRKLDYTLVKKYRFFVEACEYQRHFLHLQLDYAIIINLELDHVDYFRDFWDYEQAFIEMLDHVKEKCLVLPNLASETILMHPKVETLQHFLSFDFKHLIGAFQQENANLVFSLLNGIIKNQDMLIKEQIEAFHGVWRRMEEVATLENGVKIYSDYGHVAGSIWIGYDALRAKFPDKKLICIFQPHQIHRIQQGWEDFPRAMKRFDEVFVYDIYAARENYTSQEVAELGEAFAQHVGGKYLSTFSQIKEKIEQADSQSVVVLFTAGAGDLELRTWLKNRISF